MGDCSKYIGEIMQKITMIFLGAFAAASIAACGPDNVAACKEDVEAVNALECIDEETALDADEQCPEALNESTVDQSDYYECVYGQYTCNGDEDTYSFEEAECTIAAE